MKFSLFLLIFTTSIFQGFSQDSTLHDEKKIVQVINQFFLALEKKDSLLMQQTTMHEAQIWRRYNNEKPARVDVRFSKDDLPKMASLPDVKEIARNMDIKVHDGIAVAWVPYEFWREGKFSHCGIDVFTLFEIKGNWKIITAAYTVETNDCKMILKGN